MQPSAAIRGAMLGIFILMPCCQLYQYAFAFEYPFIFPSSDGGAPFFLQDPKIIELSGGHVVHESNGSVAPLVHMQAGYAPNVPAGHAIQSAVPAGLPLAHTQLLMTVVLPSTHDDPEHVYGVTLYGVPAH